MKTLLTLFTLCFLTTTASAQSRADYDHTVKKIGKFFNLKMADSLVKMYSGKTEDRDKSIWSMHDLEEFKLHNGKMRAYEYAGEENGITLYKTDFARSKHIMG